LIITKDAITLELANGDLKVINSMEKKTGKVIAEQNGAILNYRKEKTLKI
jgi:hypothetical protein